MSELIVMAVSIFAAGMGLLGLSSPAAMVKFVTKWWQTRSALWAAAAIRLLFGIALWQAAAGSPFPAFFKILGAIAVLSAFTLPLIGITRFKAMLAWWSTRQPAVVRSWAAAAVLVGGFLIWSLTA